MSVIAPTKVNLAGIPELWIEPAGGFPTCPGCHLGILARLLAEVLRDMRIDGNTIGIFGVGCHAFISWGLQIDSVKCAHGRAQDLATGIKRTHPDTVVMTVQGDGDCTSIGGGALLAALNRGERITVIMVNNTNYGTTGGQIAPTSLLGQITPTTPHGRDARNEGYPMHTAELVASFKGVAFSARGALDNPANVQQTKKYLQTAFQRQLEGVGYSFVEVLSACPPNWHLSPVESLERIKEQVIGEFPLGVFKDVEHVA